MTRSTVRAAFFLGLILAATVGRTQDGDNRTDPVRTPYYSLGDAPLIRLLVNPEIQKELGLDQTDSEKVLAALRELHPGTFALQKPEEREQRLAEIKAIADETQRKSEELIQKSLTREQFQRFQQLQLQRLGGRALLQPETAKQLALTTEQEKRLKTINEEFRLSGARAITEKYQSDLLEVLTPEQTAEWKAMTGSPFEFPKTLRDVPWRMIVAPEVQRELGLSEEVATALTQSLTAIQSETMPERMKALRGPNPAAPRPVDRMDLVQQTVDAVRLLLTVAQWNRLQEIILQDMGLPSIKHPDVAEKPGLNQEQRDRVNEVAKEYRRAPRDRARLRAEEQRTRQLKEQADLLEILTADQRKQWEAMQGVKVDPRILNRPGVSPVGN